MNEQIKLFGSIALRSSFSWLKIVVAGGVLAIAGFCIALWLYGNQSGAGFAGSRAGGAGAFIGLLYLFAEEFWTALLLFGSLICMFLFFPFASKYALQKALYLTWQRGLGSFFVERLNAYLDRMGPGSNRPEVPQGLEKGPAIKKRLMDEAGKDPGTNKIQKRIFRYLLRKVQLDDIDFSAPVAAIRAALVQKMKDCIGEKIAPSRTPFWILTGIIVLMVVLALIFDHH